MQQILSEFTSDERDQLANLLERLVASVDRAVETLDDPAEPRRTDSPDIPHA